MIEVTRYVASDGKEFAKREDCIEYENTTELREMVKAISTYCRTTYCENCCFAEGSSNYCMLNEQAPESWEDYL